MLVPVKLLRNPMIEIDQDMREVTYFHILCDRHVVLVANGMPCESLLRADLAKTVFERAAADEVSDLFPELDNFGAIDSPPAFPIMRAFEARAIFAD